MSIKPGRLTRGLWEKGKRPGAGPPREANPGEKGNQDPGGKIAPGATRGPELRAAPIGDSTSRRPMKRAARCAAESTRRCNRHAGLHKKRIARVMNRTAPQQRGRTSDSQPKNSHVARPTEAQRNLRKRATQPRRRSVGCGKRNKQRTRTMRWAPTQGGDSSPAQPSASRAPQAGRRRPRRHVGCP